MEDYLKATDLLTISGDKVALRKQVAELKEKTKDNEYIIKGKLQEKEDEIKTIKEQFNSMQSQIRSLISAVGCINEIDKKEVAKQLIENGVYKQEDIEPVQG